MCVEYTIYSILCAIASASIPISISRGHLLAQPGSQYLSQTRPACLSYSQAVIARSGITQSPPPILRSSLEGKAPRRDPAVRLPGGPNGDKSVSPSLVSPRKQMQGKEGGGPAILIPQNTQVRHHRAQG